MNYSALIRRGALGVLLVTGMDVTSPAHAKSPDLLPEFRPIGATGNNILHSELEPVPGSAELRIAPLNFAAAGDTLVDGRNARSISNLIAGGTGAQGQSADTDDPVASAWLYVFGQFVDHDLDLESTPPDGADISIAVPAGDPLFPAGTTIAMTRDVRNPATNTIINTVAGYLDLSQLYGSTPAVAAGLRNADGTLKSSAGGTALPVSNGMFITGDPRVMENPELSVVTILFMREHNRWVAQLRARHADWSGDQLYDMARAITIGEYQNIVYDEYLPLLVGNCIGSYRGYNPDVSAQVTQEFSTAAFRLGHSQVSDTQEGVDNNGSTTFTEPLAQAFFNSATEDEANGIDPLLRAIGLDNSQASDVYAVSTLRNLLFAGLVGGEVDQIDLIAIDIQRERDVGLGSLNQTRLALGLPAFTSFTQLTSDPVLAQQFEQLYVNIDDVDLFMGGLAEAHVKGAEVGSTFQAILASQFQALRAGDRFFWQNQPFDKATAAMIGATTLGDLIRRNTDTTVTARNVFRVPSANSHHKPSSQSVVVDDHGRRGAPFIIR
jgi:peroxidase